MSAETDGFAVAEMPDTPRVIAEFSDYPRLLDALRVRALELQASAETFDELSGLPRGYWGKLLSPHPPRRLGMRSLGDVFGVLAIKCLVVEDLEAKARIAGRLKKRDEKMVRAGTVHFEFSRRFLRKIQRKGGKNSRKNMTPEEASELGRRAALARWAAP